MDRVGDELQEVLTLDHGIATVTDCSWQPWGSGAWCATQCPRARTARSVHTRIPRQIAQPSLLTLPSFSWQKQPLLNAFILIGVEVTSSLGFGYAYVLLPQCAVPLERCL